jgi:hypothetical protein
MSKLFISYRRGDSAVFTGRLYDRLIQYYGTGRVFLDIDSIPTAVDFRTSVRNHLRSSGVVIAVIGRHWLGIENESRRIDEPEDYVRLEIELALSENKPIVPIYCDETEPLPPSLLPESIRRVSYLNALSVDPGRDFDHHVARLRGEINQIIYSSPTKRIENLMRRLFKTFKWKMLGLSIAVGAIGFFRDEIATLIVTSRGVSRVAQRYDKTAFAARKLATVDIARGLPSWDALTSQTDLVSTIRESKFSFDIFTLTGSAFFNNFEALEEALSNGARFRVVLVDHSQKHFEEVLAYFKQHGYGESEARWSASNSTLAGEVFRKLAKKYDGGSSGKFELRWWTRSYSNSFWIRDGNDPKLALAHIEISYYGDAALNPSIRFGSLAPQMVASLSEQFEYIWTNSRLDEVP